MSAFTLRQMPSEDGFDSKFELTEVNDAYPEGHVHGSLVFRTAVDDAAVIAAACGAWGLRHDAQFTVKRSK